LGSNWPSNGKCEWLVVSETAAVAVEVPVGLEAAVRVGVADGVIPWVTVGVGLTVTAAGDGEEGCDAEGLPLGVATAIGVSTVGVELGEGAA
jgi:hypothetical protein